MLVSLARSIGKGTPPKGLEVTQLMETTVRGLGRDRSRAPRERDQGRQGRAGAGAARRGGGAGERQPADPDGLAPAPKPEDEQGLRLVVFGDSDFADNQLLQANVGNSVLLTGALDWLVQRSGLSGIPPKKTEQVHLSLTRGELRSVYLLSLLVLPGLGVILGVWIYFRRRR